MIIAGVVDLEHALGQLAQLRPVFHSESDFQLALAWQVRLEAPDVQVRLETRPLTNIHLDLAFQDPVTGHSTAVEVKYLTRFWAGTVNGERYDLKNQGAQDIRAYDVIKDITRVESFIVDMPASNGAVVVLANDPSYWRLPRADDTSNAAAFRLCEGNALEGVRDWGTRTGDGTRKGREAALHILGRYELHWTPYSRLPGSSPACEFRQLVVPIVQ